MSPRLPNGRRDLAAAVNSRCPQSCLGGTPNGDGTDAGAYEVQPQSPPVVLGLSVNDGQAQRSEVRSITVIFSTLVDLPSNPATAFQLTKVGSSTSIAVVVDTSPSLSTQTVVRLTFNVDSTTLGSEASAGLIDGVSTQLPQNGVLPSLADGKYSLSILAANVTAHNAPHAALDGNRDGTAGDDYVSPPDTAGSGTGHVYGMYRLFGDGNGDATVDLTDLSEFRDTFNSFAPSVSYVGYYDANNDLSIDLTDLSEFRNRFNILLFP